MAMQPLGKPGISLSIKRGEITIFRSTIDALGRPKYVRLLIDCKKKKFALQALEHKDKDAFAVPIKTNHSKWAFVICSLRYIQLIWYLGNWESDYSYRLYGQWNEEENLLEFFLDEAVLTSEGMEIVHDVVLDCDFVSNNCNEMKED